MPTLASEIARRYEAMRSQGVTCLPPLETLGLEELVVGVILRISPLYDRGGDYTEAIRDMSKHVSAPLTDEEFSRQYPIVKEFLDWLVPELRRPL